MIKLPVYFAHVTVEKKYLSNDLYHLAFLKIRKSFFETFIKSILSNTLYLFPLSHLILFLWKDNDDTIE